MREALKENFHQAMTEAGKNEEKLVNFIARFVREVALARPKSSGGYLRLDYIRALQPKVTLGAIEEIVSRHYHKIQTLAGTKFHMEDTQPGGYGTARVAVLEIDGLGGEEGSSPLYDKARVLREKKFTRAQDRHAEMLARLEELAPTLKKHPHPYDWRADKGDSLYDYGKYILSSGTTVTDKKRRLMEDAEKAAKKKPPAAFAKLAARVAAAPEVKAGHVYFQAGPYKVTGSTDRRVLVSGPPYHKGITGGARNLAGSWNGSAWEVPSFYLDEAVQLCALYAPKGKGK